VIELCLKKLDVKSESLHRWVTVDGMDDESTKVRNEVASTALLEVQLDLV
jgi:hypothetical protein